MELEKIIACFMCVISLISIMAYKENDNGWPVKWVSILLFMVSLMYGMYLNN